MNTYRLQKLAVILTVSLIPFVALSAESAENELLIAKFPDGFTRTGPVEYYDLGNLFELINGQAVFYFSYGFVKLHHSFYEKDNISYKVDVYELRDDLAALGSYREQKDEDTIPLDAGTEGYILDYLAVFYKNKYYVEIVPVDEGNSAAMKTLAGYVEKRLPGSSELPEELELFPREGLIPNSESYIGENLLSYTFLGHGLTAEYKLNEDSKVFKVFISLAKNVEETQKILTEFTRRLNNATSITLNGMNGGVKGTMPYRGGAYLFIYKNYAFGCFGASNDNEAMTVLKKLPEKLIAFTKEPNM